MRSSVKKVLVDFVGGKPIKVPVKKIINQRRNLIKKSIIGFAGLVIASSIAVGSYFLIDHGIKQRIAQYKQRDREWTRQGLIDYGQEDRERTAEDFRTYEQRDREWTRQGLNEGITQYEQRDKGWTEERLKKYEEMVRQNTELKIGEYEGRDKEWTRENFEIGVPLEELAEALSSTYKVVNQAYYETREGNMINPGGGTGSGILLKGGYLLTARHVVNENFPWQFSHSYWGLMKYHHNELSIEGNGSSCGLEMILSGRSRPLDYALLKLSEEDSKDLPFYSPGLNLPDKPVLGMRSAAIGFPLGTGRNLRLGNVSQIKSNVGDCFLTFKNSIIFGDSGGPIFVLENGKAKLTSISSMLTIMRDHNVSGVIHPTNIGYGLKVSNMVEDMEERLELGEFDEETAEQVENFLKLNKVK